MVQGERNEETDEDDDIRIMKRIIESVTKPQEKAAKKSGDH